MATIQALLIPVYDAPEVLDVEVTKDSGCYQAITDAVGGPIELVRCPGGQNAYAHEEGRIMQLPYNMLASAIVGGDIVGPVIVFGPIDGSGNETSVDDRFVQIVTGFAR